MSKKTDLATLHKWALKEDGWENPLTGMGGSNDKGLSRFRAKKLPDYESLISLYEEDPLFYRIASRAVEEAFRPGYELSSLEPQDIEAIKEAAKLVGASLHPNDPTIDAAVIEAQSLANATGGAAVLMFFEGDDPNTLATPRARGKALLSLRVKSAQDIYPTNHSTSDRAPTTYTVVGTESFEIHESRVIPFYGESVSLRHRRLMRGWGQSKFVKPMDYVRRYMTAMGSLGFLLADMAQGVLKIKNLWGAVGTASAADELKVQKRLAFTDLNRSSGKSLLLDTEESFSREATPLGGAGEVVREFKSGLAMAADTPETELWGRSAAGMNATGEGDQDKWYASIGVHRKRHLKPRLTRIYGALAEGIGKKAPDLEFNPLSTKDAKAVAETNKLEAEEADILITASVVTPEEVRLARAQGKGLFEMVDLAKEEAERVKTLAIPDNPEPEEEETDKGEGANGTGGVMPAITTATDNAEITLVHEARKSLGLPPFTGPWAKYNNNTVAEFRTRRQTEVEAELLQQFPPTVVPVPTAPNTPEAPKEPAK